MNKQEFLSHIDASNLSIEAKNQAKIQHAIATKAEIMDYELEWQNTPTPTPIPEVIVKPKKAKKAAAIKRVTFRQNDAILVFTLGTTSNKKIAEKGAKIVQTYSYSRGQFEEAMKPKTSMREFFAQDGKVCFDCPFSVSNGAKLSACYTHKMMQYSGFISQLRSIGREFGSFEAIPELNAELAIKIMDMAKGRFVRFGSYGEPSLIPFSLVQGITEQANNWTGYTHQWTRKPEYSAFFMASTHTAAQEKIAREKGFKSFVASPIAIPQLVSCPASNEMGFKSNCAKCGLCSGTQGKGTKSIIILEH